jgi:hypothetical protein
MSLPSENAHATIAIPFAKKGEFVSRTIAGETILVPVRGQIGDLNSIYNLSEVAAFIWERIDGRRTVRELVAEVCNEFDVSADIARRDACEFIGDLERAGLIEPVPRAEDRLA